MDILGYLKNTHKSPKFGRVRQVPIRELGWEFPGWDLSHFAKFGIFMGILYKAERNNDDSSTVRISLPFKDQVAANAVRKQLRDLSHKIFIFFLS